ncbi:MAG: FecR domain-containing protein [Chitinophagaceae bacterium]|nr:FecR domain-containing protein [Chitinophagaceae bacterium]
MEKVTPELLRKYQQGTCTMPEKVLVENWLAEGDTDSEVYPGSAEMASRQEKKIWSHIAGHMETTSSVRFFTSRNIWMTAACFVIVLSAAAWVLFSKQTITTEKVAQLKQSNTNYGEQKKMMLADNSVVRLNAGSALEYPASFSGKERIVKLVRGEAYFEIAKDSIRPFQVNILDASIKVLGTHFNVNLRGAYHHTIITLTEGKIAFTTADGNQYLLHPGQQIIYDTALRKVINIVPADTTIAMAWTEDKIIFRDTPMESALQQIELKYNTRFDIKDQQLKRIPLTAAFSSESLDQVLHMLELASGIHFNKKDNVIQVSK